MNSMRQLLLSPIIIALAFTLPHPAMTVIQVIAGIVYGVIGILNIRMGREDKRDVERGLPVGKIPDNS